MSDALEQGMSIDNQIVDPEIYADRDRYHRLFTWLRANEPVRWTEPDDFRPFWTLSRHADISEVSRKPDIFLNAPRLTLLPTEVELKLREEVGSNNLMNTMLSTDGSEHQALRAVGNEWLSPRGVAKLTGDIREIATHYVDLMARMGHECDFAQDVAAWFPLRVILSIFGLTPDLEPMLNRLSREFINAQDPSIDHHGPMGEHMLRVWREFGEFFSVLAEDRRKNPRDDLATAIVNARIDGEPLSERKLFSYYALVVVAGHDTTATSLAGGVAELLRHPDQLARLKADPKLIPLAADEMVRWVHPVKHFMRTAARDYELASGQKIREGEALLLALPSGCRDEAVFKDPFTFQIDRKPNPHVGFGIGAHVCLGQHLARLELATFLEVLLSRLEEVKLDAEPVESSTLFLHNIDHMPVRYRLKQAA